MTKTKIILIDSNSLVNRAFHALPPLVLADGMYTNAIFGYVSMLQKIISEEKPTHICAVFDCRAKTFRHLRYDGYKATRKPMAEELAKQIPLLQELLKSMGITIKMMEGVEADDIIGTLAKRFGEDTLIVTGDRDCLQLVDETTTVYLTKRGVSEVIKYTSQELLASEGFTPEQIIEYKGLAGDSSDNIPGAPGVGPKTAHDLLLQYRDIDGIYEHIDEIKGKLAEKLKDNKDKVYLSKELATICTDVEIPCTLEEIEFRYPLSQEAYNMMQKLRFKNLLDRFEFNEGIALSGENKISEAQRTELRNVAEMEAVISSIPENAEIAIYFAEKIVFSDGKTEWVLNTRTDLFGDGISDEAAARVFSKILTEKYRKVFFDVKAFKKIMCEYGVEVNLPYDDLSLQGYLLNPGRNIKNVGDLLSDYGYAGENTASEMLLLEEELRRKIRETELTDLYEKIELPLADCLFRMEKKGFRVDIAVMDELDKQYTEEIAVLLKEIYEIAGEEFNVNSPKQLAYILFDKLALPHSKKNKTGYSVDANVLEELDHPICEVLLKYRRLMKLKSTYIDGMRNLVNKKTFRTHTCFKQNLTATGRLSSTEPNLQNIPVRRAEGKEIRKMFIPSENCMLLSADYSQIELRLLAHFSNDESLIAAYGKDADIHALTASKIFGVPLEEVTENMRSSAKAVNFGIIYGISSFGLAKNASVSNYQAKRFIEEYFRTYPGVKQFMDNNVREAKEKGFLRTLMGRIRYFPELTSSKYNIRSFGERAAMNMPLQGSASDIIKKAMLDVSYELQKRGLKAELILQVHDELILDVPIEEVEEVKILVKDKMENVCKLRVPLVVNVAVGKNWYEAK